MTSRSENLVKWSGAVLAAVLAVAACGWALMPIAGPGPISPALAQISPAATVDQKLQMLSLAAADRANYLAYKQSVTAAFSALLGLVTLLAAAVAALYAKASADQARRSADIANATLAASERAWLTVEMDKVAPWEFARDGGMGVSIALNITNIGKTPALNAHTQVDMTLDLFSVPQVLEKLCQDNLYIDQRSSRMVLPQQSYIREWGATCHPAEVEVHGVDSIVPVVYGCITYQTLPDKALRQTAFAFMLTVNDNDDARQSLISRRNQAAGSEIMASWTTGGFAT